MSSSGGRAHHMCSTRSHASHTSRHSSRAADPHSSHAYASPAAARLEGRPVLVVQSWDERLYLLDAGSGIPLWRARTGPLLWTHAFQGDSLWSSPAVALAGGGLLWWNDVRTDELAKQSNPDDPGSGTVRLRQSEYNELMAYRITAGSFDEMIVEVEASGGEFEPIPEVEWVEDESSRGDGS